VSIWTTPERNQLRKAVRSFAEREILPNVDEWERTGELPRELHRRAGKAGLLGAGFPAAAAVEAGEWVAHQAVQLFGGMGYMSESEVERQYRDMRILGIGGGTTEILTALAAKSLGFQS
jgi:alkylation response protein AidB-like acyl-CoA dehydrogenase